jgi:hypothetical protein
MAIASTLMLAAIKDIKVMETIKSRRPVFTLGKPWSSRMKRILGNVGPEAFERASATG